MTRGTRNGKAVAAGAAPVPNVTQGKAVKDDRRQDRKAIFQKTVMCKFYLQKKCSKGQRCGFAHNEEDLAEKPDFSCTRMCKDLLEKGMCGDPKCQYAHSTDELRENAATRAKAAKAAAAQAKAIEQQARAAPYAPEPTAPPSLQACPVPRGGVPRGGVWCTVSGTAAYLQPQSNGFLVEDDDDEEELFLGPVKPRKSTTNKQGDPLSRQSTADATDANGGVFSRQSTASSAWADMDDEDLEDTELTPSPVDSNSLPSPIRKNDEEVESLGGMTLLVKNTFIEYGSPDGIEFIARRHGLHRVRSAPGSLRFCF